ncbi:MAG: head maturation protease, ClpP-related, partial [Dyella sp.]
MPIANSPIAPVLALRAAQAGVYELIIYGLIGESWWEETVTATDVVAQLDALPPDTQQVHVRINSDGGSVPDGLVIYNALKRLNAQVIVTVDGVAQSIASLIAMAGDEVRMPATSIMMVHAPGTGLFANAAGMREMADTLDKWAASMAPAYAAKTGMSIEQEFLKARIPYVLSGKTRFLDRMEVKDALAYL